MCVQNFRHIEMCPQLHHCNPSATLGNQLARNFDSIEPTYYQETIRSRILVQHGHDRAKPKGRPELPTIQPSSHHIRTAW